MTFSKGLSLNFSDKSEEQTNFHRCNIEDVTIGMSPTYDNREMTGTLSRIFPTEGFRLPTNFCDAPVRIRTEYFFLHASSSLVNGEVAIGGGFFCRMSDE